MSASRKGKLQRVLVGTDFTAGAAVALARACRLPLGARAAVTLVHVLPRTGLAAIDARAGSLAVTALDAEAARASRILQRRGLDHIEVETVVARGAVGDEIARRAKRARAEIIVVGRHGTRESTKLFLGSTPGRVLRASHVPLLVVQRRGRNPYERVLVGAEMDGSTRRAIQMAARLAADAGATLRVLHVMPGPFDFSLRMVGTLEREIEKYRRRGLASARDRLERLLARTRRTGVTVRSMVLAGDPRDVLLAAARRTRTELLALGTHGRVGMSRALVGSVAESVLRLAHCDVLVAPGTGR